MIDYDQAVDEYINRVQHRFPLCPRTTTSAGVQTVKTPISPLCECGADKAKTTHAFYCPKFKEFK